MQNRYEPPTDPAAWVSHPTQSIGDPYQDFPTRIDRIDEPPDAARTVGLRRLFRLTWRATQLSAVTAAGFATLFARTAPAQTAVGHATPAPGSKLSTSPPTTPTPSPAQ